MKVGNKYFTIRRGISFSALWICILVAAYDHEGSARTPSIDTGTDRNRNVTGKESEKSDFGKKALSDAEEERSYRKDNVVITVKKLYAEDRYYWNFEITVDNQNDIKKTVEGTICLYNMYIQPRECGAEECAVNIAVQPKSVQIQKYRCRGKMDMNSWSFLIIKVHNF